MPGSSFIDLLERLARLGELLLLHQLLAVLEQRVGLVLVAGEGGGGDEHEREGQELHWTVNTALSSWPKEIGNETVWRSPLAAIVKPPWTQPARIT